MILNTTPTWEQLLEIAQNRTPQRRVRRPGQSPFTVSIPSRLHKLPLEPSLREISQDRAEAAEWLSDNHEAAIRDILKNSEVHLATSKDVAAVNTAIVEFHLKLLADYLLHSERTLIIRDGVDGKENIDPLFSKVGKVALAYVRNRICAPRDTSAGAAIAFRAAADQLLASLY